MCSCEADFEYSDEQKSCVYRDYGVIIGVSIAGGVAFLALALSTAYLFFWKGNQRRSIENNHDINVRSNESRGPLQGS